MVYNLLQKFNKVDGATSTGKPQRIIFYRDGVSEDSKDLERELSAILRACKKLDTDYKPPVTFIVVQKNHHTTLFPEDEKDESRLGRNVPPGTVVVSGFVKLREFFLHSHDPIDGSSRPTCYWVWRDQSFFQANDIQMLTYYMCYLFTHSLSYPAPCYYSHLVAIRGRQYYDKLKENRKVVNLADLQSHFDSTRDLNSMFFI